MRNLWDTEPVIVIASVGVVAEAALVAAIAFGLPIDPAQKVSLEGLGAAIITGVSAVVARTQVSPVATLPPVQEVPHV